jgi:hypothetical protein
MRGLCPPVIAIYARILNFDRKDREDDSIQLGRVVGQHKGFKEKPISPADCSINRVETQ